jgi:4-amino-4-deoxy-L-arabinose transferase-like glycosyltransferase
MSQIWWLVLAVALAVLLDLYIIRSWRRYRRIRQEDWTFWKKIRAWFSIPVGKREDSAIQRAIESWRKTYRSVSKWKITKVLGLLSSVGLVAAGQYLVSRSETIEALSSTSQVINRRYRIDVDNLDNVLVGIPLLLAGGVLFYLSTTEVNFRGGLIPFRNGREQINPTKLSSWRTGMMVGCGGLIFLLIRLFFTQPKSIDTFTWVISIGGFLFAALWWDKSAKVSLDMNLTPSEIIQVLLIFALGLIIGIYQLQDIPNSLVGDEGNFFETARQIALGEYHPSIFDTGVYSYPILSSFWQAWILRIFGISFWGWRFASVLPSMLTVLPLYLLSRDMFGRGVAVFSSLVLIFSPYFLAFSRLGYNNSQSIFVVTLAVWLIYTGIEKRSSFYSFLGGAVVGLGFLTYTAGRLGLVISCVYFLSFFLAKTSRTEKKQVLINLFLPVLVGWVVITGPYLFYNQKNAPKVSRYKMMESLFFHTHYGRDFYSEAELTSYAPLLQIDEHEFFYNPKIYSDLIVRGFVRSLLAFHHEDIISEHYISDSLSGPYTSIFLTLGGFFVFGRLRDKRYLLIALWFASGLFLLSMISTFPPRHQHLVPVIPAMMIMISLGVFAFSRQLVSFIPVKHKTKQILQFSVVIGIVLFQGFIGIREYFIVMPDIYRPNIENAMNWFGLYNSSEVNFVFIHSEPMHEEWRPYFFRELLTEHQFMLLSAEGFLESELDLSLNSDVAVFYDQFNTEQITQELFRTLLNPKEISFLNRNQDIIGKVVIQGEVAIPSHTPFLYGLLDVLISPMMKLFVPLLLFISFYWYKHRQDLRIGLPIGWYDEFAENQTLQDGLTTEQAEEPSGNESQPFISLKKEEGFFEVRVYVRYEFRGYIYRFEPKISIRSSKEEDTD